MNLTFFHSKPILIAELLGFMAGLPVLIWLYASPNYILPVVWGMALICYLIARYVDPLRETGTWNWSAVNRKNFLPILARFVVCALLMLAATAVFKPEMLFGFIREKPKLWAVVMVMYPIISVVAQEIVYRRYMFARFSRLLTPPGLLILVSGAGFGFGHIVFDNWVAPALCAVGGVLFSYTYHKTRSLALVCIEHAIYGNAVFTIGLGRYFYHGAVGAGH
jgi:membrane protease YdiL (CAAX protease family)